MSRTADLSRTLDRSEDRDPHSPCARCHAECAASELADSPSGDQCRACAHMAARADRLAGLPDGYRIEHRRDHYYVTRPGDGIWFTAAKTEQRAILLAQADADGRHA